LGTRTHIISIWLFASKVLLDRVETTSTETLIWCVPQRLFKKHHTSWRDDTNGALPAGGSVIAPLHGEKDTCVCEAQPALATVAVEE